MTPPTCPVNRPTSAPVLVVQGTDDALIPYAATTDWSTGHTVPRPARHGRYVPDRRSRATPAPWWTEHRSSSRGSQARSEPEDSRPPNRPRITPTNPLGDRSAAGRRQTSRKRRTAKADPITPTPMPTTATRMQVPTTSHPPSDIWAMMFPGWPRSWLVSSPIPQ